MEHQQLRGKDSMLNLNMVRPPLFLGRNYSRMQKRIALLQVGSTLKLSEALCWLCLCNLARLLCPSYPDACWHVQQLRLRVVSVVSVLKLRALFFGNYSSNKMKGSPMHNGVPLGEGLGKGPTTNGPEKVPPQGCIRGKPSLVIFCDKRPFQSRSINLIFKIYLGKLHISDLHQWIRLKAWENRPGIKYDDGNSGKCNHSGTNNKRGKHKPVNRATSSGQMQQSKRKVKMTNIEGGKNDGDSSNKLAGPKKMDAKLAAKDTNLSQRPSSPALVKNHPSAELQAPMVDVPILTYSRNPANFRSKIKCPPLNTVEEARVFPLKTDHSILQKTNKSPGNSRMKVGDGGDLYDKVHRNFKDRSFPVKIDSTSRILLHDEVSSKCWHNDKSGGSRESIDVPSCYKSPLKDPKAEKFKEIKNEIFAMVSNQQVAAYIPGAKEEQMFAETYNLEGKMEDKLCDLCELYLQGLEGDKDAQVHKLLIELAELWPKGVMDHRKLTEAINRSKSRRAVAIKNQDENVVDNVKMKQVRLPCQKRKVTDLSDNCNCIPSLTRKAAPNKATIEQQPVLQCKSSDSLTKAVKLTVKQKPLVSQNVKVKFLLKQEHDTLKASEKRAKDVLKHRSITTSVMCKQPST